MIIKNIAMIGMGAIGSVYGKYLYDKYDNDFAVIAGGTRAQKLESGGVSVNGQVFYPKVIVPEEKRWKADLLLVCVKNEQLDDALVDVKNIVGTNTIILSLLSGVSAVSKIESVFPDNITLSGMAIGLDVAREDSTIVSNALGKMDISGSNGKFVEEQVAAVKACLGDAGIDSEVLNDANSQMWKRWLFNIGVNQVASVLGLKYGQIEKVPMAVGLMRLVMQEAIGVTNEINKMLEAGVDMVICTGGMSVDPDDKTPLAIKNAGTDIVTYGAPVLPGAMFLLSYKGETPVIGLPGCVMYAKRTIFDLVLPRMAAGIRLSQKDINCLGEGGLCLSCPECVYPNCGFGKGM